MIYNNSILEKDTSTLSILSPIPVTYPEEAVGTTTNMTTTISKILTKTCPETRLNGTKIIKLNIGNIITEILPHIIPR